MKIRAMNSCMGREISAGETADRCCGKCRHCEKGQGEKLRCRRHKIETYFAAMCKECEPSMAPEG